MAVHLSEPCAMPYLGMSPESDRTRLKLLSMALRVGNFGYFVQDVATNMIVWAPETYAIWGVEHAPGIPNPQWLLESIHPDDRNMILGWRANTKWASEVAEFRIIRPNGEVRHICTHMERTHHEDGRLALAYGILLDQTERRSAETALQQSETRFQNLFETSGAGMVTTASDATILFINKALANLLGYEPEELLGKSIRDLSPDDTKAATFDMVRNMRRGNAPRRDLEKPYIHRNGELIWARLTMNRYINHQGKEEFIGIIQDLTDRYRSDAKLRDSEAMLNTAQSIGKLGHWVWWIESGVVEWSGELCRIMGNQTIVPSAEGDRMRKYVHPDDRQAFEAALATLMVGRGPENLEFRIIRDDGTVRTVMGRAMPPEHTPHGRRMIGTIQDITESKAREEALRRESVKAEAASRAKTLFLANMSHELRTPLNAVLGFAQLLEMQTKGTLNSDQKSYVDNIVRGGEHLLRLINDVLDLSRIDSGHFPLTLSPINITKICESALSSFGQLAAQRGVAMRLKSDRSGPYMVIGDHMRLTQVLTNLVSNAVKYNRTGGDVTVLIEDSRRLKARISVIDTGQGIPKERQAEVFQHFNRLGAETQGIEGTGIGLSLSKRLVEEMNGTMGFVSEPNVSTTFWFELQLSQAAGIANQPVTHAAQ